MAETKMSDIIRASLDGIKELTERETFIGDPILTPSGVTVIPVSKISIGFATGGVDYTTRKPTTHGNFGGGGGSGVSITPVAFLTVDREAAVNLVPVEDKTGTDAVLRTIDLIENSPELIKKIKNALF